MQSEERMPSQIATTMKRSWYEDLETGLAQVKTLRHFWWLVKGFWKVLKVIEHEVKWRMIRGIYNLSYLIHRSA